MQSVAQIFHELNQLAHVELQYSSTLHSYQITNKLFELIKENISKQISSRTSQMKYFSTEQGIGLRKIMLQHYEKLLSKVILNHKKKVIQEHKILSQVTLSIYQKHKAMENSLRFIEPIVKEMEHKQKVLRKQLTHIQQKNQQLYKIRQNLKSKSSRQKINNFAYQILTKFQTQQIQTSQKIHPIERNSKQSQQNLPYTLFSIRKFEKIQTESQIQQIQSFLDLKLQQVQQFIRIQKELAQKTTKRIFEILDETLGKGLQNLQLNLLSFIKSKITKQSQSAPRILFCSNQNEHQGQSDSSSSADLNCYETMEQILEDKRNFEKIKHVKKKLYSSAQTNQIDGVSFTNSIEQADKNQEQQIEVSPTFNSVCPLILQSAEFINQFDIVNENQVDQLDSDEDIKVQNTAPYLYDSFSKENFNTMNN